MSLKYEPSSEPAVLYTPLTFSERMPHLLNPQSLPFDSGKASGTLHQLQFPQLWTEMLGQIDFDPGYNQVQNSLAQNRKAGSEGSGDVVTQHVHNTSSASKRRGNNLK